MSKKLLFSVTKKDLVRQTFRCGGKGGQNVNKVETGVRFIHEKSKARGESTTHRTQHQNEQEAWKRLVDSKEFKLWLKLEASRIMGKRTPEEIAEEKTEKAMQEINLVVEVIDESGEWQKEL